MRNIKSLDSVELCALASDMHFFKDAGFRILLPAGYKDDFLVYMARDYLVIGPSNSGIIGLVFSDELRTNHVDPIKIVKPPFVLSCEQSVSIGGKDFHIYSNLQSLDSVGSLVYNRPMQGAPLDWILNTGAVIVSR